MTRFSDVGATVAALNIRLPAADEPVTVEFSWASPTTVEWAVEAAGQTIATIPAGTSTHQVEFPATALNDPRGWSLSRDHQTVATGHVLLATPGRPAADGPVTIEVVDGATVQISDPSGPAGPPGPAPDGGTPGQVVGMLGDETIGWLDQTGDVESVNGQTGAVVLDADDVGADPTGTAAGLIDGLATVATTGDYSDLTGQPVIPSSASEIAVDSAPWGGTADKVQGALGEITTGFGAVLDGLATDLAALTRVPGLEPWYQALQDRADTIADPSGVPVDVVLFGDSLTSYPSPLFCWPSKAAAGINRAWTTRPSPDQPFHCAGAVASVGMRGTVGGTLNTTAVGRDGRDLTDGQTITADIGSAATGVGIVYQERSSGGTLTVRHTDGSGAVLATIDTDGSTTRSRVHWITGPIALTGFERLIHVTSTGNTTVEAVQPTTAGQVTRWWNCSAFGTKASNPTAQPLVGLSLLSALVDDPAANPKLVILGYGTNQVDAAEYTTQMSALIAAAQDRAPDAQIVAWLPHRGPTWTDDRWAEIRAAAPSLGVPILDAATPAPLSNDGTHPIAPDRAMSRSLGGRLSGNLLAYLMADLETVRGDVQARNATGDRTLSLIAELGGMSFLRFQAPGSDMTLAFGPDGVTVASPIGVITGTPDGLLSAGTLRLPPMASLPAGPNAAGTIANHNGTLKICTTAGSPGTWAVIGTQT